jgi:periplasmic protein TonB
MGCGESGSDNECKSPQTPSHRAPPCPLLSCFVESKAVTLQYNISNGQPDRPVQLARASRWMLGGAVAGSLGLHALAAAVALMALSGTGPPAEDAATITVFAEPESVPVATATESRSEPPAPPSDFVPPPDEAPPPEFKTVTPDLPAPPEPPPPPDFKTPRPPIPAPKPVQAAPRPKAAPAPTQEATTSSPAPATATAPPSVVPGWNALITAWLSAHKKYPEEARRRSEEGDVTVRFVVAADGHVTEVTVVKGSGSTALDQSVVGMLRGAALPAPGVETARTVRIRFNLRD